MYTVVLGKQDRKRWGKSNIARNRQSDSTKWSSSVCRPGERTILTGDKRNVVVRPILRTIHSVTTGTYMFPVFRLLTYLFHCPVLLHTVIRSDGEVAKPVIFFNCNACSNVIPRTSCIEWFINTTIVCVKTVVPFGANCKSWWSTCVEPIPVHVAPPLLRELYHFLQTQRWNLHTSQGSHWLWNSNCTIIKTLAIDYRRWISNSRKSGSSVCWFFNNETSIYRIHNQWICRSDSNDCSSASS